MGSSPVAVILTSDFALASSSGFLDIQATIECRFSLKCVRDMIKTYILVYGRAGAGAAARQADEINKRVIFKNFSVFINCKT